MLGHADLTTARLNTSSSSGRHLTVRVELDSGGGFFIKQPDPLVAGGRNALRTESLFYAFCHDEPAASAVRRLIPGLRAFLADESAMVLELVPGGCLRWGAASGAARAAGRALATVHWTLRLPGLADDPRLGELPEDPPPLLSMHRPGSALLRDLSPATLDLLRFVQGREEMTAGLEAAAAGWRAVSLIHGDFRADNVLAFETAADGVPRIHLVDWELLRWGDPAWDVAGALRDVALCCVFAGSEEPELRLDARLRDQVREALRADLRAFWMGYQETARLSASASADLLCRAVRYGGAQLIQSSWEFSASAARLRPLVSSLLDESASILAHPAHAAAEIFGLAAPPVAT